MSAIHPTTRRSPVKINGTQPAYCVFNEPARQSFNNQRSGWGNRHCHDDAPFTFWDEESGVFRDPTKDEVLWIGKEFRATCVNVQFPHICIKTLHPPHPIPCTVAAALVRFAPPDMNIELTPPFAFRPYGDQRRDLLASNLPLYEFPEPSKCAEIINKLLLEVKMRAVQELATGSIHERRSLPGRAGGINIIYHDSPTPCWSGTGEKGYSRLLEPSELIEDTSDYLSAEPRMLSPGVCLASAALDNSGLLTNTWRTTTVGIMLQRGTERLLSVSNHGFKMSAEVYHPTPLGRRIGRIVERLPELDIALVSLDPSISFSNERYFQAPAPRRMVPYAQVSAGDNFELDGISTGRLDLVAIGRSFYIEDLISPAVEYKADDAQGWRIEVMFSVFGPTGQLARDEVCGAPFVDVAGRVGGFFRYTEASNLFAHTPALDGLIRRGWMVV